MHSGRAKKIRQMIGYDIRADNIMGRQYQKTKKGIECVGIRQSYRKLKKKINRREE